MASYMFTHAKSRLGAAGINWAAQTYKVMFIGGFNTLNLLDTAQLAQFLTDPLLTAALAHEFGGSGYTVGGETLAGKASSISGITTLYTGNNIVINPMGPGGTPGTNDTITDLLIYRSTGVPATDEPFLRIDLTASYTGQNASFTIQWSTGQVIWTIS